MEDGAKLDWRLVTEGVLVWTDIRGRRRPGIVSRFVSRKTVELLLEDTRETVRRPVTAISVRKVK